MRCSTYEHAVNAHDGSRLAALVRPMSHLSPRLRWACDDGVSPKLAELLEAEAVLIGR